MVIKKLVAEVLWGYKNQTYTTTRWAWVQLLLSSAFFCIGLSLAIIALGLSIPNIIKMPIGIICAGIIAGIFILIGIILAVLALRMGYYWYKVGSKDPTATKSDIDKLSSPKDKLGHQNKSKRK